MMLFKKKSDYAGGHDAVDFSSDAAFELPEFSADGPAVGLSLAAQDGLAPPKEIGARPRQRMGARVDVSEPDGLEPVTDEAVAEEPETGPSETELALMAEAEAAAQKPKRRRNRTRLLGFEPGPGSALDAEGADDDEAEEEMVAKVRFPAGMLAVIDGPGRGEFFVITAGLTSIGRGEDQGICLNFGDTTISRENHATLVFDDEANEFLIAQGANKNAVRLNGEPLVGTELVDDGSWIRIGETTLRFIAFCNEEFNWTQEI